MTDWWGLVRETVQDPPGAAEQILSLGLSRSTLYQALIALVAINTLFFGIEHYRNPTENGVLMGLDNPMLSFFIGFGGLMVLIHLYYWAGRAVGGTGSLGDFLALFVWFQVISLLCSILQIFAFLLMPALGLLVSMAVFIFSIYLIVHFLRIGLGLPSLWHAAGILVFVPLGAIMGLAVIMALIGVSGPGGAVNV